MVFPKKEFNKASVKDADLNKGLLVDMFNKIDDESINIHSMLLLKEGSRVFRASAYDFDEDTKDNVYSVSKSFTSIAIGILCDLKLLNLEDYILFFFSEEVEEYLPGYEKIQIKHLLTMSIGQEVDVFKDLTPGTDLIGTFFQQKLIHEPGKVFMYNNYGCFLLSAIVTKVTGRSLNDFLNEYLYQPIGMEKPNWQQVKNISFGATGLEISANDMARFGLLLLNDGEWDGKQIVSKEFLAKAGIRQIGTVEPGTEGETEDFGYGYCFWMNGFGDYRASGLFNQHIIINKEHKLVFAVKSYEERDVIELFVNYILKASEVGYEYCDYSLRDYIRRFKNNSKEIIENEKEIRLG